MLYVLDHNFDFSPCPTLLRSFSWNSACAFHVGEVYGVACEKNNAALCIQRVCHTILCSIYLLSGSEKRGEREKSSPILLRSPSSGVAGKVILSNLCFVITHCALVERRGWRRKKVSTATLYVRKRLKLEAGEEEKIVSSYNDAI